MVKLKPFFIASAIEIVILCSRLSSKFGKKTILLSDKEKYWIILRVCCITLLLWSTLQSLIIYINFIITKFSDFFFLIWWQLKTILFRWLSQNKHCRDFSYSLFKFLTCVYYIITITHWSDNLSMYMWPNNRTYTLIE